jgi:regulator of replication initiation timing
MLDGFFVEFQNMLLEIPGVLIAIGAILGGAIIGILNLFGFIGGVKSSDIKTAKEAADFVTCSLENKIAILEQKIEDQKQAIAELTKKTDTIITENRILRDVLQGKDEKTQIFQTQGFESFKKTSEILDLVKNTNVMGHELANRT